MCTRTVCALIALRRPSHRIGWALGGAGLALVVTFVGWAIGGLRAATAGPTDLLGGIFSLVGVVGFNAALAAISLVLLLFPDGRLPSPRWRIAVALPLAAMGVSAVSIALVPIADPDLGVNPIGIDDPTVVAIIFPLTGLAEPAFLLAALLGVAAVATRLRRGDRETRQQLKWFLAAIATVVLLSLLTPPSEEFGVVDLLETLSIALVPIAIGIAVLRYRLYDIDRLISRTISWALVSAVLAVVFLGGMVALQAALANMTQGDAIAVAVSTLLAFALFQPVRTRIQRLVDRRFDRARYDAAAVIAAFAGDLRQQPDLTSLGLDIAKVASASVRPTSVGIWIRQRPEARTR